MKWDENLDTLLILLVRLGVAGVCRSQATVQPRNQPPREI
jgi:hypothetical protein